MTGSGADRAVGGIAARDGNHLLGDLPPDDRLAVLAAAQAFDFPRGHVFCEPGDLPTHMTFIDSGVISALAVMEDGRSIESYMVGREGVTHPLATEAPTVCHARLVAQTSGSGRRIEVGRLKDLAEVRPAIREALARYLSRLMRELEQSTACNALHRAEQRFAKWLLRCHDRSQDDELRLTQEALASMLGSQRTTVNEAAQQLQSRGAIRYVRGKIRVLDRAALERAACECYAAHHPGPAPDPGGAVSRPPGRTGS